LIVSWRLQLRKPDGGSSGMIRERLWYGHINQGGEPVWLPAYFLLYLDVIKNNGYE
jgi:hypothetical protein